MPSFQDPDDKTASILNIAGHHAGGKSSGRSRILYQLFTCSGQKPDMRFCVTSTHNSLARTSYMAPSNRMVGQEMQSYQMAKNRKTWRTTVMADLPFWPARDVDHSPSHRQDTLISSSVSPAGKSRLASKKAQSRISRWPAVL